ncbi:SRPBCC family protein [Rhodococcus tibetensis]|uniref:SRPBCC family protein n=1 Tax=Rhodococcus tibetensis TaxID=2965064 RepID=A0ABT1QB51_9NOCA|nr:SRPBCC family protein [Rhodococcus sp. FXJ9.536]MCQ4119494.1 SRPBCC family protein [Rhodococcus sp. FXJ9.536]
MTCESTHVSVFISRTAADVYAYASDPANLPAWAAGLSSTITREGDHWVADSPMGQVSVAFAPTNDFGVLDHNVTLPGGDTVYNPVRVIPDGEHSEVVFTLRRRDGMGADEFTADASAVTADLQRLKGLLEA